MNRFCDVHEGHPEFKNANKPPAPDFTIALNNHEVLLELAQYRDQGPQNDAVERDAEFGEFYLTSWLYDPAVNRYDLALVYRIASSGRPLVPGVRKGQKDAGQAVAQLKELVQSLGPQVCRSRVGVYVVPKTEIEKRKRRDQRNLFVAEEDYPILARHFVRVYVRHTNSALVGCPQTSIGKGHYAPDWKAMRKVLKAKHDKLPQYRTVAANRPVWLLYYEEGGCTGRIPPATLDEVIQFLRTEISKFQDHFDAVWWGHDLFCPTASLHRITY